MSGPHPSQPLRAAPEQARLTALLLPCSEDHPFFLCTQFHPEFNSVPGRPSPPFVGLLLAATQQLESACPPGADGQTEELAALLANQL